jgi:hypothetical protein
MARSGMDHRYLSMRFLGSMHKAWEIILGAWAAGGACVPEMRAPVHWLANVDIQLDTARNDVQVD